MASIDRSRLRELARAITVVENATAGREAILDAAFAAGLRSGAAIGVTGSIGVGKSTLVNALIGHHRRSGRTVGVIAVDPSSPFSGGAVLGDRIRMSDHNADPGVFIRSLASRNALGGLSAATQDVLHLYRAFGFDCVLVESVGVGQAELDIARCVDVTAVVLVPGCGDSIQFSKAGIMEVADLFVINKADHPGVEEFEVQLQQVLHTYPERDMPPIVRTVASKAQGIDTLAAVIDGALLRGQEHRDAKLRARLRHGIRAHVAARIATQIDANIDKIIDSVMDSSISPLQAAEAIVRHLKTEDLRLTPFDFDGKGRLSSSGTLSGKD